MGDNAKVVPAGGAGFKIMELFNGGAETYFHSGKIKKEFFDIYFEKSFSVIP